MIVAHWALVEGSMAEHYGVSLHDIWRMSWRRFRTLYDHLFTAGHLTMNNPDQDTSSGPQADPTPPGRQPKFDPIGDWNRIVGKAPPERARRITFDEFANNFGVKREVI